MDTSERYEEWMNGIKNDDISGAELKIACDEVREELEKHGEFYEAFVASARSAINELPTGEALSSDEIARFVVDRITGEV